MFPLTSVTWTADGNIGPCRFLTTVSGTTKFQKVVQASDSTKIIVGVSGRNVRYAPGSPGDDGFNVIAGEELNDARGPFQEATLKLGGTVNNQGQLLTTDASGQGIAADPTNGTVTWFGALALQQGVSGDFIPVFVLAPTPTC